MKDSSFRQRVVSAPACSSANVVLFSHLCYKVLNSLNYLLFFVFFVFFLICKLFCLFYFCKNKQPFEKMKQKSSQFIIAVGYQVP